MTRHLLSVLALPFNVLVVIPAIVLWRNGASLAGPAAVRPWLALACFAVGLTLMVRTIRLFGTEGEGTLAPWDPTRKLVVTGIYRHVRNPMISGVIANLVGESLLFGSWALFAWAVVFAGANAIYIPLSEEPGLERRFGEDYRRYRANVPRWLPRLSPWRGGEPDAAPPS